MTLEKDDYSVDSSILKASFQKLIGQENYQYWAGQMQSTLILHEVWDVVSGNSTRPPDPTPEADLEKEDFLSRNGNNEESWNRYKVIDTKLKKWKRKNMKAALLIRTHVCEMILAEIQGETTAKGIWDCFTKNYKTNTMAPLLHTNEKIRSTKIDNFKTPTEYVAKMRSLFDERKRFNHAINDDEKIYFLIEGLNSRYRELIDRFKNYTAEQWNVTSVGNAIITFTIPSANIPSAKPTAGANMIVHRNVNKRKYQESQDKKSHNNLGAQNQEKQRCPHCKMRNHKPENCWFKYPEQRPPKHPKIEAYSTSTNPKPKEMALRTRITPCSYEDNGLSDNTWLVDSGATKHFCRERTAFKTISPYVAIIEIANGETLE
jgi:hypothetical protein